jgi:hypothetical protein
LSLRLAPHRATFLLLSRLNALCAADPASPRARSWAPLSGADDLADNLKGWGRPVPPSRRRASGARPAALRVLF